MKVLPPGAALRRFRVPEIVLGFLFASAFWLLVATIYPAQYGNETQTHNQADSAAKNESESSETFWQRATKDPTAFFTLWVAAFTFILAGSTIALWIETRCSSQRQSRDMRLSIMATRRSANAAVRAAENAEKALHSLEVPHVFPVNMTFTVKHDQHGAPETAFISISLKNFGRSPGFPKQVYIIAAVRGSDRRRNEFHSGKKYFMPDDVIGDKEIFGPLTVEIKELARYAHRIKDRALELGVLVHHDTEDLMNRAVGRGAWYVWNPKTERFSPGVQLWADN